MLPLAPVAPPPPVAWDAPPEEVEAAKSIEFSWAGEAARRIGTVAHGWLQRIAEDGLERWDVEKVSGLGKSFRANLVARGIGERDLDAAVTSVERTLANAIGDERGRWILGKHPQAHNELRLTMAAGNVRRTFVLDRHFVDANGERWIVDYKTSRHEGAGAERSEEHTSELQSQSNLVCRLLLEKKNDRVKGGGDRQHPGERGRPRHGARDSAPRRHDVRAGERRRRVPGPDHGS